MVAPPGGSAPVSALRKKLVGRPSGAWSIPVRLGPGDRLVGGHEGFGVVVLGDPLGNLEQMDVARGDAGQFPGAMPGS